MKDNRIKHSIDNIMILDNIIKKYYYVRYFCFSLLKYTLILVSFILIYFIISFSFYIARYSDLPITCIKDIYDCEGSMINNSNYDFQYILNYCPWDIHQIDTDNDGIPCNNNEL